MVAACECSLGTIPIYTKSTCPRFIKPDAGCARCKERCVLLGQPLRWSVKQESALLDPLPTRTQASQDNSRQMAPPDTWTDFSPSALAACKARDKGGGGPAPMGRSTAQSSGEGHGKISGRLGQIGTDSHVFSHRQLDAHVAQPCSTRGGRTNHARRNSRCAAPHVANYAILSPAVCSLIDLNCGCSAACWIDGVAEH